jgi:hypothetical protein
VSIDSTLEKEKKEQCPSHIGNEMEPPTTGKDIKPIASIGELGKDIEMIGDA